MEKTETKDDSSTAKLIVVLIGFVIVLLICGAVILLLLLFPFFAARQQTNIIPPNTPQPNVSSEPDRIKSPATINLTKVCDIDQSPVSFHIPEGWNCTKNYIAESGIFRLVADSDTSSHIKIKLTNEGTDLPCYPGQSMTCEIGEYITVSAGAFTLYRDNGAGLIFGKLNTLDPSIYMTVTFDNIANKDLSGPEDQLLKSILGDISLK